MCIFWESVHPNNYVCIRMGECGTMCVSESDVCVCVVGVIERLGEFERV